MRTRGFTLLEVMIVMAVLGLLTAGAILNLMPTLAAARSEDALRQLEELDAQARLICRQLGKDCKLVFDGQKGLVYRVYEGDSAKIGMTTFPRNLVISQIRVHGRDTKANMANVWISKNGFGPTYAVEVRSGPDVHWVVLAGRGGQSKRFSSENDVQAIFEHLQATPEGNDAR